MNGTMARIMLKQARPEKGGDGGRGHSWPTELWGRDKLGLGQGVFPLTQSPLLGSWGLWHCWPILGRGLRVGFPQSGFPRDYRVCSQAPSIPVTPLGAAGLFSQPRTGQGVGAQKEVVDV